MAQKSHVEYFEENVPMHGLLRHEDDDFRPRLYSKAKTDANFADRLFELGVALRNKANQPDFEGKITHLQQEAAKQPTRSQLIAVFEKGLKNWNTVPTKLNARHTTWLTFFDENVPMHGLLRISNSDFRKTLHGLLQKKPNVASRLYQLGHNLKKLTDQPDFKSKWTTVLLGARELENKPEELLNYLEQYATKKGLENAKLPPDAQKMADELKVSEIKLIAASTHPVYRANHPDYGDVVIKVLPMSDIKKEDAQLLAEVANHVTAPEILEYKKLSNDKVAIVTPLMRGKPLEEHTALSSEMYAQLGKTLAKIHSIKISAPVRAYLAGKSSSAKISGRTIKGIKERLTGIPVHQQMPLTRVLNNLNLDTDTLIHGDFHPENIFVTSNGRISGVIDWDNAHIGDKYYDIANALYYLHASRIRHNSKVQEDHFLDGYGKLTPEENKKIIRWKVALAAHHKLNDVDPHANKIFEETLQDAKKVLPELK